MPPPSIPSRQGDAETPGRGDAATRRQRDAETEGSSPGPRVSASPRLAVRGAVAGGSWRQITIAATILIGSQIASRALGLLREVVIAHQFGTGDQYAAYAAAFKIPDLLFQLVAGGVFGSAFIPVFSTYFSRRHTDQAWLIASSAFNLVLIVSVALSGLAAVFAPWLVPLLAPGFSPDVQQLVVELTRIMLVTPVCFGLSGIATGILQGRQHFLLPALAPLAYNLAIIAGALLLAPWIEIRGLAIGVAAGSALHLLIQVPGLVRQGLRYRPVAALGHPGVREVIVLLAPRVLGLTANQFIFLAYINLASTISTEAVAALNYAWVLTMLPLGIFGMAISTAAFPTMSEQVGAGRLGEAGRTFAGLLRLILFLTVPAGVGLMLLREPITRVLLERGQFDAASTAAVAWPLLFFAAGLFAHGTIEIAARAFYALHDTRTPVALALLSVAINVLLAAVLVGPLAQGGPALAMTVAAVVEAGLLVLLIQRRFGRILDVVFARSFLRVVAATAVMAAVLLALAAFVPPPAGFLANLVRLLVAIGAGAAAYLLCAIALGSDEVGVVRRAMRRG